MAIALPPWLTPSDPAPAVLRGFTLGAEIGNRQAAQRFQEMQMARQEQLDAMQQARWEADMGLKAAEAARRYEAQRQYQTAIESGVDPLDAMIRFGPAMGQQASAEAAAIRAMYQKEKVVPTWQEQETPSGSKYLLSSTGDVRMLPRSQAQSALTPEDVKSFHVLDPDTGKPLPEFLAVPSPTGKGMTPLRRGASGAPTWYQKQSLKARYLAEFAKLRKENPTFDLSENAEPPALASKNKVLAAMWAEAKADADRIRKSLRDLETVGSQPQVDFEIKSIRQLDSEGEEDYGGVDDFGE